MTGSRPGQEALIISYFARRIAGRLASWRAMVQRRSSSSRSSLSSALSICAICQPNFCGRSRIELLEKTIDFQPFFSLPGHVVESTVRLSGQVSTYLGFFEFPQLVHIETSRNPVAPEGICDKCRTRVDRWFSSHSLLLLHWDV